MTPVLVAHGTRDPAGVALAGCRVRVGYLATGTPRLTSLVDELRAAGERRVAVGCWLLAPGTFHRAVGGCGADVVAEPIGTHPAVLDRLAQLAGSVVTPSRPGPYCVTASGDENMACPIAPAPADRQRE